LTAVKVPDCRSGLASDVAIGAQQRAPAHKRGRGSCDRLARVES